mmetsp:Transcript_111164/g.314565  ORF Transcript_111164/g.314565 Transcript_111164/m.314565 type:complete len:200 (+) Transcript_111164:404-1003(+)
MCRWISRCDPCSCTGMPSCCCSGCCSKRPAFGSPALAAAPGAAFDIRSFASSWAFCSSACLSRRSRCNSRSRSVRFEVSDFWFSRSRTMCSISASRAFRARDSSSFRFSHLLSSLTFLRWRSSSSDSASSMLDFILSALVASSFFLRAWCSRCFSRSSCSLRCRISRMSFRIACRSPAPSSSTLSAGARTKRPPSSVPP